MSQALQFIEAIKGSSDLNCFFTTIYELRSNPDRKQVFNLPNDNLVDSMEDLKRLNERDHGIFVTINDIKEGSKTRFAKDVTNIRALFVDVDDGRPIPDEWALEPSVVVRTSKVGDQTKWQAYWLVDDCAVDEFTNAQSQLIAYYNSDEAPKDPSRLMRVPGFYHRKYEPVKSVLMKCDKDLRYSVKDVLDAHPAEFKAKTDHGLKTVETDDDYDEFYEWARSLAETKGGEGERNKTAIHIAGQAKAHLCSPDQAFTAVQEYCTIVGTADRKGGNEASDAVKWAYDNLGDNWRPVCVDVFMKAKTKDLIKKIKESGDKQDLLDAAGTVGKMSESQWAVFREEVAKVLHMKAVDLNNMRKEELKNAKNAKRKKDNKRAVDEGLTVLADGNDFPAVARSLLSSKFSKSKLVFYNGGYYCYNGKHYELRSEKWLESVLYGWLERAVVDSEKGIVPFKPNIQSVANVRKALDAKCYYEGQFPCWRGDDRPEGTLICFKNGILSLETGVLHDHTYKLFSTHFQDYEYDPSAKCPVFMETLSQWFPTENLSATTLKRILGYLISGDNRRQKIFVLAGVPRSGKSSMAALIEQLMPATVATSYEQLGSRFGLNGLLSSSVAILGDASLGRSSNKSTIINRLKQISGGDLVEVEPKGKDLISTRLSCRFVITTNDVVSLKDASGALNKRMVPVKFTETFYGREDKKRGDKLAEEISGIANWALEGIKELETCPKGEEWLYSEETKDYMDSLVEAGSPVEVFANERLEREGEIATVDLYTAFTEWSEDEGYFKIPKNKFLDDLAASGQWKFKKMKIDAVDSNGKVVLGANKRPKRVSGVRGLRLMTGVAVDAHSGRNSESDGFPI